MSTTHIVKIKTNYSVVETDQIDETAYIPKLGEFVYYSDGKFKVGDGNNTPLINLPYGGAGADIDLTNIDLIGQGESTLVSENVAAFGKLNSVGQKGFNIVIPEDSTATDDKGDSYPILPTDWINGTYYILDSVEGLAVGDTFSIRLTEHRYNYSSITGVDSTTNKVTVKNFYNEADLFIKNNPRFWVLSKPSVGTIDIGNSAFAAGVENKSQGYCSIALGGYNNAQGWYGAAIGQNNIVRYCGCAIGKDNQSTGNCGVTIGDGNRASEYGAVALGVRNSVSAPAGAALGVDNIVSARAGAVFGDQNNNNAESAIIGGFDNTANSAAKYSATFGQENTANGQGALICGKLCTTNEHLSAALGEGIITSARAQVAVGKFNATRSGSIFLVGTGTGTEASQRKTSFEVLTNGETRVHDKLCVRDTNNSNDMVWANAEGKLWAKTKIACAGLVETETLTVKSTISIGGITLDLANKWTPNSNGY